MGNFYEDYFVKCSHVVICFVLFLLIACGPNDVFCADDVLNSENGATESVSNGGVTATTRSSDDISTPSKSGTQEVTTKPRISSTTHGGEHNDERNHTTSTPTTQSSKVTEVPTDTDRQVNEFITMSFYVTSSFIVDIHRATLEHVEAVMNMKKFTNYLDTYTNDIQRKVVTNQMKYCPYLSLCDFDPFASPPEDSCCSACDCDIDTCLERKTCCPSILSEHVFTLSNYTDVEIPNENKGTTGGDTVEITCVSQHLSHQTGKGLKAIADCPGGVDTDLRNLCSKVYTKQTGLVDSTPVYSKTTGINFRNKHCARCNNVADIDVVYSTPIFSCYNQSNFESVNGEADAISLAYDNYDCDILFANKDQGHMFDTCEYVIDTCNVTGKWKTYDPVLEMACPLYTSQMYQLGGVEYNNVFCALCNGVAPSVNCYVDHPATNAVFPFSGLLSLDSEQALVSKESPTVKDLKSSCNSEQFFDVLFEKCRNVSCPESTYYHMGACVAAFKGVTSNMMYNVDMRLLPTTAATVEELVAVENGLFKEIYDAFICVNKDLRFCSQLMAFKTDLIFSKSNASLTNSAGVTYIDIRFKLLLEKRVGFQNPNQMSDSILSMRDKILKVDRVFYTPLEFQIVFTQFDTRYFNLIELVYDSGKISYALQQNGPTERLDILSGFAFSDVDDFMIIPNIPDSRVVECMYDGPLKDIHVLEHSSCPKIHVSSKDIKWTTIKDGIMVEELKIDRGNFYFTDDQQIMMCLEQYEEMIQHILPSRSLSAEMIVSITCSSLSIVSLFVTIITFAIFPKLHKSIPGHNNMCLSVALILAQIMLLVGTLGLFDQYSTACKSVGLVLHFSWLCVVFWMNVCTYHVFITLTRSTLPSQRFNVKKCISYHAYVLTLSLMFVGLNILIAGLETKGLGYGGKHCYITSQQRILITFVVPTVLVVCVNLCLFLFVICKMSAASVVRKSVNHERNDLIIFAKLATLTGVSWIFGFLYIWTNSSVLSYIFTVLNAGQGVLIFVSFVLNRRVMGMFRGRFVRSHADEQIAKHPVSKSKSDNTDSSMF